MTNFHKYLKKLGIEPGTPMATQIAADLLDKQLANAGTWERAQRNAQFPDHGKVGR